MPQVVKKWAVQEHSEITEMELVSQFRCNGSNGYLAWVDDLLEISWNLADGQAFAISENSVNEAGCYIYCTDPGLREYIRNRLKA